MILPLRKSVVQSYKTLQPSDIPVFFNSPSVNFIDWGGGGAGYIKLNTHQRGTQTIKGAFVEAIRATTWEYIYPGFQVMRMIEWGQKSKPKKIPTLKINPQKYHAEFPSGNKFGYTLFAELLCTWLGYVGTTTNRQIVLNTPKNPYLNQATQQTKILATFSCPPKKPRIKTFNPVLS